MAAVRDPLSVTQPALARATVYQALAHVFHHPAPERRRGEALPGVRAALDILRLPSAVAGSLAEAEARLSSLTPRRLAAQHVALFSHGREGQALPYEADFTAVSVFQKSQEMADVAGFYRAFGLAWESGQERPDHLSLECEFMYFLALKEAYALAQGRREDAALCRHAQRAFRRRRHGRGRRLLRRLLHGGDGSLLLEVDGDLRLVCRQARAVVRIEWRCAQTASSGDGGGDIDANDLLQVLSP